MKRPRVLIADDHRILAEGLRSLLEPEFEVVGIVGDGEELVDAARRLCPDAIVADVSMPKLSGLEAAGRIMASNPAAKLVLLTMHRELSYARRALEAGALGYVLKHSAAAELLDAVRAALAGRPYVSASISGDLLQSYSSSGGNAHGAARLTPRQREVLQLSAAGRSAKEVAAILHISRRTAEFHKARVLEILGLANTAELVQFAIRNGLIEV